LYDWSTGTWSIGDSMNNARFYHVASVLTSGKVLVIGGAFGSTVFNSAELYQSF
jgi:hypothetical protein